MVVGSGGLVVVVVVGSLGEKVGYLVGGREERVNGVRVSERGMRGKEAVEKT